ncbi:spore coat protein [Litchfieldia salsa]|uniref:Spore coat protein F n=1 Tax=Litchfieldia salsa TaxID=930152 RepID=A0A1H0RP86_9BACI|nr:spore coat protein [Litchfieldia salsa]SDP31294.1 spore coat protein F [Litchfieldia salsa]
MNYLPNSNYSVEQRQKTLAYHETLELHELVAFQSNGLMKLKMAVGKIKCSTLKGIYLKMINDLETNLNELLVFYPMTPRNNSDQTSDWDKAFYAGDLLGFLKASVRNYAIAITETATPELKAVLIKQLQRAIKGHTQVFNYMYQRGMYPAYDLGQLLNNDVMLAKQALSMRY